MYKIAAMGDKDSVSGFASIGLDIFTEDRMDDPAQTLHNLAANDYAIIYITETLAEQIMTEIEKYNDRRLPVIVPIPGVGGATHIGMRSISKAVERAVGSDILKDA